MKKTLILTLLLSLVILLTVVIFIAGGNSQTIPKDNQIAEDTQASASVCQPVIATQLSQFADIIHIENTQEFDTNLNPLTGLAGITDEAVGMRPVAVMVNNIKPAFPQYGIAQADVIFEIPVEGNQTRFMALYADYTQVPKICSVRSCRKYFPAISEGFDAIYVNWGMSGAIESYVKSLKLTQYDGKYNAGGMFGRDMERRNAGYALEHTSYFDGTMLADVVKADGVRIEIEDDKKGTAFQFNSVVTKPSGNACTEVNVDFGAALATFTYDEVSNIYLKAHNGVAQMDGVTGTQLAFANVLVLEAKITADANGTHRDVNWHGGNGYYVSNGAMQKITWSKKNEQSPMKFYDEAGNELSINRGKTYIAINYIGQATFQ